MDINIYPQPGDVYYSSSTASSVYKIVVVSVGPGIVAYDECEQGVGSKRHVSNLNTFWRIATP